MELCDYYFRYLTALGEGTMPAPDGVVLSGDSVGERMASLQASLATLGVPEFVRRCAAVSGDPLPAGLLEEFDADTFAREMLARLTSAAPPDDPADDIPDALAEATDSSDAAPDPDAGKHAFEVLCDCVLLDDGLVGYLIEVLKTHDRAGFSRISQVTTKLDLDPAEFLYWLSHREDYAESDTERACAVIVDSLLERLMREGQSDVAAALLAGDRMTFDAVRCEAGELRQLPVATFRWFEENYLDRDYPLRFVLKCNGVEFPDTLEKEL